MKYKIGSVILIAPFSCSATTKQVPFTVAPKQKNFTITSQSSVVAQPVNLATSGSALLYYRSLDSYTASKGISRPQRKSFMKLHQQARKAIVTNNLQLSVVENFCLLLACQKSSADFRTFLARREEKSLACARNLRLLSSDAASEDLLPTLAAVTSQLQELSKETVNYQRQLGAELLNSAATFNSAGGTVSKISNSQLRLLKTSLVQQSATFLACLEDLQQRLLKIFVEADQQLPHLSLMMHSKTYGDLWLQSQLLSRKVSETAVMKNIFLPKIQKPKLTSPSLIARKTRITSAEKIHQIEMSGGGNPGVDFFNLKVTLALLSNHLKSLNCFAPAAEWHQLLTSELRFQKLSHS